MGNNCCTTELKLEPIWFPAFEKDLPSLSGKRIAITGTTSGTGRVAALTCLKKGAEVFMLNRESKRAQDALQDLQKAVPGGQVKHIPCDMQDFANVREAARLLSAACQGQLDVLCNNAGIMAVPDEATKDGYDTQMQTNHLSHFLLTSLMMPALQAAAERRGEARIVSHSSGARRGSPLDPKFLAKNGGKIGGSSMERYHHSKLANVLFTYELADRLAGSKVKAIVCTPGIAGTNLMQNNPCLSRMVSCLAQYIMQSAQDGTMPLLAGIAGPAAKSGDLLTPSLGRGNAEGELRGPVQTTVRPTKEKEPQCDNPESQKLLWAESEKAVEAEFKL